MIIVEGMDNCGKTTLVREIETALQQVGIPHTIREARGPKSKGEDLQEVHTMLESTELRVYDRTPVISDMVYGKELRGASSLEPQAWHFLYLMLHRLPLIFYCRPPTIKIFNFGDRPQMEGVIERKVSLLNRYDRLMNRIEELGYTENLIRWDYTQCSAEVAARVAVDHARKATAMTNLINQLDSENAPW